MTLPHRSPRLLLELDLTEGMPEAPSPDPLQRPLAWGRPTLRTVLRGLRRAAKDPSVVGLIARTGGQPESLARAQELRDAVLAFRASGRPAIAWAESYGEFGRGTLSYYLATAFSEIWLQPSGDLGMTGLALEATFLRGALDKAGVEPEFGARHEYKNAPNALTEREFTPPHREVLARLLDSSLEQVLDGIAAARKLTPAAVRALIDRAPLPAEEARAAGLVDRVGYRDEVYADVRERFRDPRAGEVKLRYVSRYASQGAPAEQLRRVVRRDRGMVALVDAFGAIRLGRSGFHGLGGGVGSDSLCSALRAAIADEHVRSIVLRVDSPGGSYVASDTIWRTTQLARREGKQLVASMGRVAASGGYYIAMGADRIVAQPGTITGSIGVYGGKVVTTGLLHRLGIGHDSIAVGDHARLHSPLRQFDPDERALLEEWLDRVYGDFTGKLATCRRLSPAEVDSVARGRVWTGADAAERGLVDDLGGLDDAVRIARRVAGLAESAPVRIYPHVTLTGRLRPPASSEDAESTGAAASFRAGWGTFAAAAARAGLPVAGPLTLPGLTLTG